VDSQGDHLRFKRGNFWVRAIRGMGVVEKEHFPKKQQSKLKKRPEKHLGNSKP